MRDLLTIRGRVDSKVDGMIGIGALLVLILLWWLITSLGWIKPIFLPSPGRVLEAFGEMHAKGWLISAIVKSFLRVTIALILVTAIGVPIGVLMGAVPLFDSALSKVVNGAKSVPTTGLVGLIVLWFSVEEKAKIVFLFLGAIFYMIVMVRQAVRDVNEDFLKVALDIGASGRQLITKVLLPGALPRIWDAIAVCNGIMWTYIVLAEFINNSEEQIGLGYLLFIGSRTQDSAKVFATLFIVAIISAGTDWFMGLVRRRHLAW